MKEIRSIVEDFSKNGNTPAALATVVSVEESSYRRIGARMLIYENGTWIGGISGGCLEGDALIKAQKVIQNKTPKVVTYDTLEDDEHQVGVGLGCNGKIDVLLTPIDISDPANPIRTLEEIIDTRKELILIQCVDENVEDCGRLFTETEMLNHLESTGIDKKDWDDAIELVRSKRKSQIHRFMTKAGETTFLLEWIRPEIRLIIVGDNYDIRSMVAIARDMGWPINLIGTLRKYDKTTFQRAEKVVHYDDAGTLPLDYFTAVLLMSHDYKRDMQMAIHFLPLQPRYLGLLGPRKRTIKMHKEINENHPNLSLMDYENLYSPVGLDIGAETPEEIALSILSEITKEFRSSDGTSLRDKEGTIHERD